MDLDKFEVEMVTLLSLSLKFNLLIFCITRVTSNKPEHKTNLFISDRNEDLFNYKWGF